MAANPARDARIVELYEAGVKVEEIKRITGTTTVYQALRRSGLGPGRSRRVRGNEREAAVCRAQTALVTAAANLDTDRLRIVDYTAWRAMNPDAPGVERIRALFDGWRKAVNSVGLNAGNQQSID